VAYFQARLAMGKHPVDEIEIAPGDGPAVHAL
jgi:hypothetical protein